MPKTTSTNDLREYALVAERIAQFYAAFPEGQILTELIARDSHETVVRASVYRTAADARASATGLAAEREGDGDINIVACLENTETSAIGRALANLGFLASRRRGPAAQQHFERKRHDASRLRSDRELIVAMRAGTSAAFDEFIAR